MNETELAIKVIAWLEEQHWDVYQEVIFPHASGRADIVAVRAGYLWIIECKTSLTFTVLEQAAAWRCHFRSIAVPSTRGDRGRGIVYDIARDYLRIGVLTVGGNYVREYGKAPLMREHHQRSKWMIQQLKPEHKHAAKAGSNGGGYYTPYRATMDQVKRFIAANPGCTLKEIMTEIQDRHHYASDQSARTCVRVALESWENSWCAVRFDGSANHYYLKT
jgi:hypothetical protein